MMPSFYLLFHGSSLGNWHSIIHRGLKDTEIKTNNAERGYRVQGASAEDQILWKSSQVLGVNDSCQAICEVIHRPSEMYANALTHEFYAPRYFMISPGVHTFPDSFRLTPKDLTSCL